MSEIVSFKYINFADYHSTQQLEKLTKILQENLI